MNVDTPDTKVREYGPYRDPQGNRTIVKVILQDQPDGKHRLTFTGQEFAYRSKHPFSVGQTHGSAPAALVALWERWHLNDMRAACEHQRELGWTWTTHPGAICPTCNYRLGSAWLYEPLPADILDQCDAAAGVTSWSPARDTKALES